MKNFKASLCMLLFLGCTASITVSPAAPVQKGDYPTLMDLDLAPVNHLPLECETLPYSIQPGIAVIELISVAPQVEQLPVMSLVFDSVCEGYPSKLLKPPVNVFSILNRYKPPSRHWC
jgi:hypothetical protein